MGFLFYVPFVPFGGCIIASHVAPQAKGAAIRVVAFHKY
jgi:hypothetical protein